VEFSDGRFCRLKEFMKEQLVNIPTAAAPVPQPTSPAAAATDPGAMLAGLL